MTLVKRSKFSRSRGNKTHGWGAKKENRGSGNRGGKGNAGMGKRADSKKPMAWSNEKHYGKHGFKSLKVKLSNPDVVMTLITLDKKFKEGKVNLTELGYDKLIGTGNVAKKFEITVGYATPKAIEKIEAAGGKVISESKDEFDDSSDESESEE